MHPVGTIDCRMVLFIGDNHPFQPWSLMSDFHDVIQMSCIGNDRTCPAIGKYVFKFLRSDLRIDKYKGATGF
jgi:hypothetical protein